jgi:hypothetical protein
MKQAYSRIILKDERRAHNCYYCAALIFYLQLKLYLATGRNYIIVVNTFYSLYYRADQMSINFTTSFFSTGAILVSQYINT